MARVKGTQRITMAMVARMRVLRQPGLELSAEAVARIIAFEFDIPKPNIKTVNSYAPFVRENAGPGGRPGAAGVAHFGGQGFERKGETPSKRDVMPTVIEPCPNCGWPEPVYKPKPWRT